jgi:hypothetical protein
MKRRFSKRALVGGGVGLLAAIAIGMAFAPDLNADRGGVSPSALNRIAEKNARAADSASAQMIAKSRAAAQTADALRSAEEQDNARDTARLARLDESAPPAANTASQ